MYHSLKRKPSEAGRKSGSQAHDKAAARVCALALLQCSANEPTRRLQKAGSYEAAHRALAALLSLTVANRAASQRPFCRLQPADVRGSLELVDHNCRLRGYGHDTAYRVTVDEMSDITYAFLSFDFRPVHAKADYFCKHDPDAPLETAQDAVICFSCNHVLFT